MSQIVESVAQISRRLKRDVLFVIFKECESNFITRSDKDSLDYKSYEKRIQFIKFLDLHNIKYTKAFAYEFDGFYSYDGCLYIDIEFDVSLGDNQKNINYRLLDEYLMDGDKPKDETVIFYYLSYDIAIQGAEYDDPEYWDDF